MTTPSSPGPQPTPPLSGPPPGYPVQGVAPPASGPPAYGPPPYGPPGQAYGYPPAGYQVPRYVPPPVAVPTSPGGYPLAEFTDRLVARLIDGAILGAVSMIFVVPIYLVVFLSVMPTSTVVNGDPDQAAREAFAQLQPSSRLSDVKKREPKLQRQRKIVKRRVVPPALLAARQVQFGWFGNRIW